MDFVITRTSTCEKPCEKAILEDGTIDEYHIEINSIDELMELSKDLNESVIVSHSGMIEIYDDYRE
jgi:hypothetical protein